MPFITKEKRVAAEEMWRRGNLRFLLDDGRPREEPCNICNLPHVGQKGMYDRIKADPGERWYLEISRRRGKTYFLVALACEWALKNPNCQIYYAASTVKAIKKMVRPNFRKILQNCPKELQPKWNNMDSEYRFQNGSIITVAGCDAQNYENLRGTEAHLIIIDEAAFMDDLQAVLDDVLAPMTLETGAPIIISSTPPKSLEHYCCQIAQECQEQGRYFHQTVYDNPRLTATQIEVFIHKLAHGRPIKEFKKSVSFRREMLAERVADENWLVIPEWQDRFPDAIREPEVPSHYDSYISTDTGFRDGWGVLFGYWDYAMAKLIIQDELLFFGKMVTPVCLEINKKIEELWGEKKVYKKIGDIPDLILGEMAEHGLYFSKTDRENKEEAINKVREWVSQRKVVIYPRCEKLLLQLQNTVWNTKRDDYTRNSEGHGDLIDSLIYMVRNIDRTRNPYPNSTMVNPSMFYSPRYRPKVTQETEAIYKLIGRKSKFTA